MRVFVFTLLLIVFISVLNAQVGTLPYTQDFNDEVFPPEAPAWVIRDMGGDGTWHQYQGSACSFSIDEDFMPVEPDDWLISPSFMFEAGENYAVEFYLSAFSAFYLYDFISVYAMTSDSSEECIDGNPNNILLGSGFVTREQMRIELAFTPTSMGTRHIAFRHHDCENSWGALIDNVSIYVKEEHDLAITNLTGPVFYQPTTPFVISVHNFAENAVNAGGYTIQLWHNELNEAPQPLGSPITNTPAVPVNTTVTIALNDTSEWGLSATDTPKVYQIYAVLTYEPDTTIENNTSPTITTTVYPQSYGVIDLMGGGTATDYLYPVAYARENSLSQFILTAEELGGMQNYGKVSSILMRFFNFDLPKPDERELPVKVYLANVPADYTAFAEETGWWHPSQSFTMVYNAPLPLDGQGLRDFTFTVGAGNGDDTQDFEYTGQNLIVMMYYANHYNESYHYANLWHVNRGTAGVLRTLLWYSEDASTITIDDLSDQSGYYDTIYPKIGLLFERATLGTLSGIITSQTGDAVPGAKVYLTNHPLHYTLAGEDGYYTFNHVPPNYDISVEAYGYYTLHIPSEVIEWSEEAVATKNVTMQPLPAGLTISGIIKRSDTLQGLNGATVKITGYNIEFQTTTTAFEGNDGYFILGDLYGDKTYTITASHPHFTTETMVVPLGTESEPLPAITLTELLTSPPLVTAEQNPINANQAIVSWINPLWGFSSFSHARATVDNSVGTSGAAVFTVAHRYTAEHIQGFGADGYELFKVGFVPINIATATYTVKVWLTGNASLSFPTGLSTLFEQTLPSVALGEINEVMLPYIPIPAGYQLFVGYEINTPGGYSAGIDLQNHLDGFGNLIQFGNDWNTLTSLAGLRGTWCIYVTAIEPENPQFPVPLERGHFQSMPSEGAWLKIPVPLKRGHFQSMPSEGAWLATPQHPITFPNYFLGHKPNRVTRALNSNFEVYRMTAGNTIPTTPIHTTTDQNINMAYRNLQYIDTDWGFIPNNIYQYAVRSKYTGSQYEGGYITSEAIYSNNLLKGQLVPVVINVEMQGNSVNGAVITITNETPETPDHTYTLSAGDNGSHTFSLYRNIPYEVKVELTGNQPYIQTHTFTQPVNMLNINLLALEVVYAETFNGEQPTDWTTVDADSDGYNWSFNNPQVEGPGGYNVDTATYSESYFYDSFNNRELFLYPDNWLISPVIQIPEQNNINLEFLIAAAPNVYPQYQSERVLVYIAPAGVGTPSWQTFLANREMNTENVTGNPYDEALQSGVTILDDHIVQSDRFYKLSYDLADYAGSAVRIAFRHAFCTNMYLVRIANMSINYPTFTPITISGSVVDEVGVAVAGALVTISSVLPISAMTNSSGSFTLTQVPSDATYTITVTKEGYQTNNSTQAEVGYTNYVIPTPIVLLNPTSEADVTKPQTTALRANYPNPFNPSTIIAFDMAREGVVSIDICNIKGQIVKTLVNEVRGAGQHKVVWNGQDSAGRAVSSGVYFYRMQTEGYSAVRKMLLMK